MSGNYIKQVRIPPFLQNMPLIQGVAMSVKH